MMSGGESRNETIRRKPFSTKSVTKIATWNVRSMNITGKSRTIASKMKRYGIEILGIAEARWKDTGQIRLTSGETILYSGHVGEHATHSEGVAFMISTQAKKTLIGWEPVSPRIITTKFKTNHKRISLNIIQCYAPTNDADDETKEEFYQLLKETTRKLSTRDITIIMGDINAKVGTDNTGFEEVMGTKGLGTINENGELFASFCATYNLVIGGTIFPHKPCHLATWVSPDMKTENQIDHVCISRKFRRSLQDVRVKRGADAASDHHLLVANIKLKLRKYGNQGQTIKRYDIAKLRNKEKQTHFQIEIRNRFSILNNEDHEQMTIEEYWKEFKDIVTSSCEVSVGKKKRKHQEWISAETLIKIDKRRQLKEDLNNSKTRAAKQKAQKYYSEADKEVKKGARHDKREFIAKITSEAEQAARQNNIKGLYDNIRLLTNKFKTCSRPVKDKNGITLKTTDEQRKRWVEHFTEVLNQEPPTQEAEILPARNILPMNCNQPSKAEITRAINTLKNNKSPGPDHIPAEALKAGLETSTQLLYNLIGKIWTEEDIPQDWKEGHLVKLPKKGDLSICDNYRGIMLLSVPGKVLNRILLERMKKAVDQELRDNQAGFRQNRSCADQIATLRIIIEQSLEFNSSLYTVFIDFQKAFDSLDRAVLWQLMGHYGIPEKFINIIKNTYTGMQCNIMHEGQLTDPFDITTGVRQGCLLSPFLFLLAVDWIMKQTTSNRRNGIQWTLMEQLDDLDFADDIALLSHNHQQMKDKLAILEERAAETGLIISTKKTKVLKANTTTITSLKVKATPLEEVDSFTYLGSVMDRLGGSEQDIKCRIGKARTAFRMINTIWRASNITLNTKIRLFNSNIKTILLHGCETWKTTKSLLHKLQVFINNCLRQILKIRWPDKITNIDLWKKTRQETIESELLKRKWRWIGHTLRKPAKSITRQALQWNPQGKRKVGRPRNTWRRNVTSEMESKGYKWNDITRLAQNRTRWRSVVVGLCTSMVPQA